jgi:predicted lysophospholipase L1 biosynthesis ABC-type transport system permease subunit
MPIARMSLLLAAAAAPSHACSACRPLVAARVFDASFAPTYLLLLLPLGPILAIGLGLAWGAVAEERKPEDLP